MTHRYMGVKISVSPPSMSPSAAVRRTPWTWVEPSGARPSFSETQQVTWVRYRDHLVRLRRDHHGRVPVLSVPRSSLEMNSKPTLAAAVLTSLSVRSGGSPLPYSISWAMRTCSGFDAS
eukprot:Amastigsp_a508421_2886.p4 type:complete len:119 gc:universal Amastigsp_a508421_2886:1108-752(-)